MLADRVYTEGMTTVTLREALEGTATLTLGNGRVRTFSYVRKPALIAQKCAGCGRAYRMDRWCSDALEPGVLRGTFDRATLGLGNQFRAPACSYACAGLIQGGSWMRLPEYLPLVRLEATLVRCELGITTLLKFESELIAEWEAADEFEPTTGSDSVPVVISDARRDDRPSVDDLPVAAAALLDQVARALGAADPGVIARAPFPAVVKMLDGRGYHLELVKKNR